MKTNITLTLLAIFIVFHSCKKSPGCAATTPIDIAANFSPVTVGWDLKLTYENYIAPYRYVWTGPNGWTKTVIERSVTRTNVQPGDGGTYSVKAFDDKNCLVFQGSKNIEVTPVPTAPCESTLLPNSLTSNIPGFSQVNFSSVSFSIYANETHVIAYTSSPTPPNTYLDLTFSGNNKPKPGPYKTLLQYSGTGMEHEVILRFKEGATGQWYFSDYDQKIYVRTVNNFTKISFCNLAVKANYTSSPYYISGTVTTLN